MKKRVYSRFYFENIFKIPKSKRSQAGLITTILTILLIMAAFVILYNVYHYLIKDRVANIGLDTFLVDGEIEYYLPGDLAIVNVKRKGDKVNVTGLKILFNEEDGTIYSYNTTDVPPPLGSKKYVIFINQLNPNPPSGWNFASIMSIALHYLFPDNKISKELDKEKINPEKVSPGFDKKWYCDKDEDTYGNSEGAVYNSIADAENACGAGKISPVEGDCDDVPVSGAIIHPGATEICDGVDNNCDGQIDEGCIRNYAVLESTTVNNNWKACTSATSFSGANFVTLSNLPFDILFFGENKGKTITVCKQGHIVFNPADCYTLSPNPSLSTLTDRKTIAPFLIPLGNAGAITQFYYCTETSPQKDIIIMWNDGVTSAEAVIYEDGKIDFSYNNNYRNCEAGISESSSHYYPSNPVYGTISKSYRFTPTP